MFFTKRELAARALHRVTQRQPCTPCRLDLHHRRTRERPGPRSQQASQTGQRRCHLENPPGHPARERPPDGRPRSPRPRTDRHGATGLTTVIECSPFDHGGTGPPACASLNSPTTPWSVSSTGRALELLRPLTAVIPTPPRHPKREGQQPTQACESYGATGPSTLGLDKPHQFPRPGLLGRTGPTHGESGPPAQTALHLSVTVKVPPEVTLRDHHPQTRRHRYLYKHFYPVSEGVSGFNRSRIPVWWTSRT